MSAHDRLFKLQIPADEESAPSDVVVPFRGGAVETPPSSDPAIETAEEALERLGLFDRLRPAQERLTSTWRAAWIGDGAFGMRPRPVADLARQYWTDPKPYIRDALILRVPYAAYGAPVIAVTAAAHLLLLVISYPSLLAGSALLVFVLSLFM